MPKLLNSLAFEKHGHEFERVLEAWTSGDHHSRRHVDMEAGMLTRQPGILSSTMFSFIACWSFRVLDSSSELQTTARNLSKGCRGKGAGFEKVNFADPEHLQLEARAKPPVDMATTAEASCRVSTVELKRKYEQLKSDQLQDKPKMMLRKLREVFVEKGHSEKEFEVICKVFGRHERMGELLREVRLLELEQKKPPPPQEVNV